MSRDQSRSLQEYTRSNGTAFIVSAPSGAGKTSLCRAAQQKISGLEFSVSHTTRGRRGGEEHGRDYYYVTESIFRQMIERSAFAEWAEVHGNLYGTSIEEIERTQQSVLDLLVEIDVQGARQLSSRLTNAVYIFVLPPSFEILEERLRGRGTDTEESVQRRLTIALREIKEQGNYDYIIVNDDFDTAVEEFCSIVRAERLRCKHPKQNTDIEG